MKNLGTKELYVMPAGKGYISPDGGFVHVGNGLNGCVFGKEQAKLMVKTYGLPVYKLTMQPADDLESSEWPEDQPVDNHLPYRHMTLVRNGNSIELDHWNGSKASINKYYLKPKSLGIPVLNQKWQVPGPFSRTIKIGDWLTMGDWVPLIYTKSDIKKLRAAGWEDANDGTE